MADPRNIAHDKKVAETKKHHHEEAVPATTKTPQPGRKPTLRKEDAGPGEHETFHQHQQQEEAAEAE